MAWEKRGTFKELDYKIAIILDLALESLFFQLDKFHTWLQWQWCANIFRLSEGSKNVLLNKLHNEENCNSKILAGQNL